MENSLLQRPGPTRRRIFFSAALLLAAGTAGPAVLGLALRRVAPVAARRGLAMKGYDSTAYFTAGVPRRGAAEHVVRWKGADWHFASAAEAAQFEAEPERFAPQFGGYCTRALSLQKVVRGDPEVWRIRGDKLYLFARPVGGRKFDDGPDAMIADARAYWGTLEFK